MTYSSPESVIDQVRRLGSYVGTGATQDVVVGFQPKYVHIMNVTAGAIPAGRRGGYKSDQMSGNNAIDHSGAGATGVTITATGFTLDAAVLFNNTGDNYTWLAIR